MPEPADAVIPADERPRHYHAAAAGIIHGPWQDLDPSQDLEAIGEDEQPKDPQFARIVAARAFKQAFREPKLTLDDLLTHRTVVVWRSVRYLLQLLRAPMCEGPLRTAFEANHPYQPVDPGEMDLRAAWHLPPEILRLHADWAASPLPPMPHDGLSPAELARYSAALTTCAHALAIPEGAPEARNLGRYGLAFLRDPAMLLEAIPQPHHLVQWETRLIEALMEKLPEIGDWSCVKWLRAKFALGDREALDMVREARQLAVLVTRQGEDERRAIMTMRLEKLIAHSQDVDPRVALAGMKTLAQVQGLTKGSGDDDPFSDDLDALNEVITESQDEAIRHLGLEL